VSIRLSALFIYPLKSARGIALQAAELTSRGLAFDRRFMLVDPDGLFLTQRQLPAMARLITSIHPALPAADGARTARLRVGFDQLAPLEVPLVPQAGTPCEVRIFQNSVQAIDLGAEPAAFFSGALGRPARLVYMPDDALRAVHPDYAEPGDIVSFADGFPYLLASDSSLRLLNARLAEPVPMNRFRPNLVVSGAEAFAEDQWTRVRIGEVPFEVRKPCTRCAIITTDQERGERAAKEPLTALAGFHTWQGRAAFAQNLLCRGSGRLQVGDVLEVLA
jgi:uncharacterized protein YcbX